MMKYRSGIHDYVASRGEKDLAVGQQLHCIQPGIQRVRRDPECREQLLVALHDMPAMIPFEPQVGSPLQLFLESGKLMRTTRVRAVAKEGSEMVVDTMNSRYRLKIAA